MSTAVAVNPHYLDRVVALSEDSDVQASEDIVAGNGMKLLAKGAKIDAKARDRLLAHKLSKPLESMMRVVDGVATRKIDRVAESMLDRHTLLSRLCGGASGRLLITSLRDLILTAQVDSLLSVYAAEAPHKLEHAVGIALLAAAMGMDMPGGGPGADLMLMAGLTHDVGELYVDPAILNAGAKLAPQQWKHIAAHPIIGARVLKDMPGAGAKVAHAVLHHHERLDGFGYPHGLRSEGLALPGQVLAMAELLMGLMETGQHHAERAEVAVKLIPGEFNRQLMDKVATAAHVDASHPRPGAAAPRGPSVDELVDRVVRVHGALQRFREARAPLLGQLPGHAGPLQTLMSHAVERCQRISLAFSSTGLDSHQPAEFRARLEEMDAGVQLEVAIVLREIQWRLGELQREATLRAEQLAPAEAATVARFVELTQT